jgi:hypothetical protein
LHVIKQELNEASVDKIDDIGPPTIPIDSERSAVKVSMIKRNNEIIYQSGQFNKDNDNGVP